MGYRFYVDTLEHKDLDQTIKNQVATVFVIAIVRLMKLFESCRY